MNIKTRGGGKLLPPGLREFAAEEGLDEERTAKLELIWYTIRGGKPTTVEEWRTLYAAIERYFHED